MLNLTPAAPAAPPARTAAAAAISVSLHSLHRLAPSPGALKLTTLTNGHQTVSNHISEIHGKLGEF